MSTARDGSLEIAGLTVAVRQLGNAPGPYDGSWTGTTSQSKAISFTVDRNEVTLVGLAFDVTVATCHVSGSVSFSITPRPAVENAKLGFSATIGGSSGAFFLDMSGTFTAPKTASGSFNVPIIISGGSFCFGFGSTYTWTATRP